MGKIKKDNKMTISIKAYGIKVIVELSEDATLSEAVEAMKSALNGIGYSSSLTEKIIYDN